MNQILLSALCEKDRDPVNMQEAAKMPDEDIAKHAWEGNQKAETY